MNFIYKSLTCLLFLSATCGTVNASANIAQKLEDFSDALEYIFQDKEVSFIQIGANDGVLADPLNALIKKYHWSGVLVEPLPHLFEKLKKNYKGVPNLNFANVAITDQRGTLDFYTIDVNTEWYKNHAPIWADQLGSFYPDHIYNHFGPDAPVLRFEIPCITLSDLIDQYSITDIDLLHMDTEGHDTTIILSIDFNKIKPTVIMFEQGHSYRDPQKFIDCLDYLHANGYVVFIENHVDMLMIRADRL